MLQSLFHVPAFRRLVYAIPTSGTEDEQTNIPLNLQRLFCELQLSDRPCSTAALTTSFGWGDQDTFVQHDVREFSRVLLGNIEGKLKGTDLEHSIADLFRGRLRNYRRCPNCPVNFSRDEDFYDLSVLVRGCGSLHESFEKYIEKEELTGPNQYRTEDYGLQDMEMGQEFLEFPKVLHIHLRRFDYDYDAEAQVKIDDLFEFAKEIDLRRFLVDKSSPSLFHLYGVLVHSGTVAFGHYYAYLRPSTSLSWFEFNDQIVSPAPRDDAVSNNFGGDRPFSGYVVIYVRKDAEDDIFRPVPDDSLPGHLRDWFVRRQAELAYEDRSKNQIPVTVLDDESFARNTLALRQGFYSQDLPVLRFDLGTTAEVLIDALVGGIVWK
jgi:ubiquitin carboxyl-terminal hydrolase 7